MRENALKNSNQICDDIYLRQYSRLKNYYGQIKSLRNKHIKELSLRQEHLSKIEQRVEKDFKINTDFKSMNYFSFVEVIDKSALADNERLNREKMRGRYQFKIRQDLPSPIKIAQFANEPIVFHLHKKGDFFKKIQGKHTMNM